MLSSEPIEIVEATESAVQAAAQSRRAIAEVARALPADDSGTVRLENVDLPAAVVRAIERIIRELSDGNPILLHTVSGEARELTTSQAAQLLGLSRPTLITLLDRGELPYRMVGTHRRLAVGDVLAFRRTSRRRAAPASSREDRLRGLEEMADTTEDLGLGY